MPWFRRAPDPKAPSGGGSTEIVAPVPLGVEMDVRIFVQKLAVLMELFGASGGVEPYLDALEHKSQLFRTLLAQERFEQLDMEGVETLLETVMPARKRLWPSFERKGQEELRASLRDLVYGERSLEERLEAFVAGMPAGAETDAKAEKKLRRAAHDFAAEVLHFRDPRRYPLMTRWVWDQGTHSGAIRELLKGGDTLSAVPLGSAPGVYEAARLWIAEQLAAQGVYREAHFVVDLFLAHAYADYMRAMSSGMGLLNADFGGNADPLETVKRLLGIDESPKRESRIRKAAH